MLQSLVKLTVLDLSYNLINDVTPLSGLVELRVLNLNNNAYIKDISPLKNLPKLEELMLSNNKIEDIGCIAEFASNVSLSILNLNDNEIEDLKPLTSLVNIKELYLSYNCFTSISPLVQLGRLRRIVASNNALFQSISDESIKLNRYFIEELRKKGIVVSV